MERVVVKVDPKTVKPGDLMLVAHYVKVEAVKPGEIRVVSVDGGGQFDVVGADLIGECISADFVGEHLSLPLTDVVGKLVTCFGRPLTVCFVKQPAKGKIVGEERVLRGRLLSAEPLLGRSHVEDLDLGVKDRVRLVDHRTVKWLIVDGVKYTVKK